MENTTKAQYPTRDDYMAGRVTFDEYYTAICDGLDSNMVGHLLERVRKSKDEHLNDIPLVLWDRVADAYSGRIGRNLVRHGDWNTLACRVCVLKTLAKLAVGKL